MLHFSDSIHLLTASILFQSLDDYRSHTSCMTEAERYEKTVYRGPKKGDVNAKSSKKMSKQERWLQCVADAAETAPAGLRPHFERMAMLDNVPFKPKQFRNFAMNSLPRGANQQKTIDDMWNLLKGNFDKEMEKVNSQNQGGSAAKKNEANTKEADATENAKEPKEKEEEDKSEPKAEESDSTDASVDAKKVKKTMKSILKKNRTMKAKKLRKDVLKTLALKKAVEKKVEGIMTKHIESNPKKMVFSDDGKKITWVKKD